MLDICIVGRDQEMRDLRECGFYVSGVFMHPTRCGLLGLSKAHIFHGIALESARPLDISVERFPTFMARVFLHAPL